MVFHASASGSQSRAALDSQASQGEEGRRASSGANGASLTSNGASPHANGAVEEKPATVSITLSADSARRLKAQAAESGLHQSDSGLASKSHPLLLSFGSELPCCDLDQNCQAAF